MCIRDQITQEKKTRTSIFVREIKEITITGEKRLKTYWGQNSKLTRKSETYDGMLELA